MKLSEELLHEFAKTVVPREAQIKQDKIAYGTVRIVNGETYVQFDGAGVNTPASSTVEITDGDRVMALLKDRKAVITGNISTPIAKGAATFFQGTAPSTTNRKLGDIWFDTANGYAMYRWNGSEWAEALFDYQALNVASLSSISANLGEINAGSLNIGNGKFQVASDGTLQATGATISGSITAYSGTIGGFTLEDGWMHSTHFILSPEGRTGEAYWEEIDGEMVWTEETYSWDDPRRTTALNINDNFIVSTLGEITAISGHLGVFTMDRFGLCNDSYLAGVSGSGCGAVSGAFYFGEAGYLGPREQAFSGLMLGSTFKVNSDGKLSCSDASIGVWETDISTGILKSTKIDSNDSTKSYSAYLSPDSITLDIDKEISGISTKQKSVNIDAGGLVASDPSEGDSQVSGGHVYVSWSSNNTTHMSEIAPDYIKEDNVLLENKYLKLAGGTCSGNIQILNTTTTDPLRFRLANSARIGALQVSSTGAFGLYDITDGKWLIYRNSSGTIIPNATSVNARMTFTSAPLLNNNIYLCSANSSDTVLSLIGLSSADNMWVGPYTFANRPNRITFGETIDKIYVYNSSGSQTLLSTAVSDERMKHDIYDLDHFKQFIMALRPKQFKYKYGDDTINFGFIAQEVRPILEESFDGDAALLVYNPNNAETGKFDRFNEDTFHYSMNYNQFIAPIVALEQEHEREIASLKEDISELREMLVTLIEQKA